MSIFAPRYDKLDDLIDSILSGEVALMTGADYYAMLDKFMEDDSLYHRMKSMVSVINKEYSLGLMPVYDVFLKSMSIIKE